MRSEQSHGGMVLARVSRRGSRHPNRPDRIGWHDRVVGFSLGEFCLCLGDCTRKLRRCVRVAPLPSALLIWGVDIFLK